MTKPHLAGSHIVTADVPRLARFYEAVLGESPVGSEEYVVFRTHGLALAICSQCASDIHARGATIPADNRSIILDFEVADVDAERQRLADVVPQFLLEPVTLPWGNRSMLFRDPDGNLINFFTTFHDK
jgi:catechol 2,3-dioxygenase-like lactoylglutathione lyase family enzyme